MALKIIKKQIIKSISTDGDLSKTITHVLFDDLDNEFCVIIEQLFLVESDVEPKKEDAQIIRKFKNKYLHINSVSFKADTFGKLLGFIEYADGGTLTMENTRDENI